MKLPDAEHMGIFINRVPAEIPDFYQKLPSTRCDFCCFLITSMGPNQSIFRYAAELRGIGPKGD